VQGENLLAVTDWIIAIFTIVIAASTIVYTLLTLKSLKQTRTVFLVDMVFRTVQYIENLISKYELDEDNLGRILSFFTGGMGGAIYKIDKKLGIDFAELMKAYIKAGYGISGMDKRKKGRIDNKKRG